MIIAPPSDITSLLNRARSLYQMSLGTLSNQLQIPLPENSRNAKGFIGQLLEKALGTSSGNRPELKTIPVNPAGNPLESTFICTAQLMHTHLQTFETSVVYQKLRQVLWVPIITAKRGQSLAERSIGKAILWQPSSEEMAILRSDWEEIIEMIALGKLSHITARHGTYLQLRPKGANARVLCKAIGETGEPMMTLPRGFYLRASFTARIFCYTAM